MTRRSAAAAAITLGVWLAFHPQASPAQDAHPGQEHHQQPKTSQAAPLPREAGQGAFAAIQEIVTMLEADPATDWAKVSIRDLREHLVDMDELVLGTDVEEKRLPTGLEATVKGEERTLAAIRKMVPAHAGMINGYRNWKVQAEDIGQGYRLRVTSSDPAEVTHIQGLGFFGVMASGAHHQEHHLGIASGRMVH